jgi:hypothetical protein
MLVVQQDFIDINCYEDMLRGRRKQPAVNSGLGLPHVPFPLDMSSFSTQTFQFGRAF